MPFAHPEAAAAMPEASDLDDALPHPGEVSTDDFLARLVQVHNNAESTEHEHLSWRTLANILDEAELYTPEKLKVAHWEQIQPMLKASQLHGGQLLRLRQALSPLAGEKGHQWPATPRTFGEVQKKPKGLKPGLPPGTRPWWSTDSLYSPSNINMATFIVPLERVFEGVRVPPPSSAACIADKEGFQVCLPSPLACSTQHAACATPMPSQCRCVARARAQRVLAAVWVWLAEQGIAVLLPFQALALANQLEQAVPRRQLPSYGGDPRDAAEGAGWMACGSMLPFETRRRRSWMTGLQTKMRNTSNGPRIQVLTPTPNPTPT